ncbi:tetraacyldisaccharide 4'-kinase [bacterium F11]|nr:tetraacyldisaccharide 4'-kinase [bacterium F11]
MVTRLVLFFSSLLYQIGLSFDRWRKSKNAVRLPRPVISIGNITVGGTGKTPLLIRLAEDLKKYNVKPVVLSRGYRGPFRISSRPQIILGSDVPMEEGLNDEAFLVAERLVDVPVGVGVNRGKVGQMLIDSVPLDLFILDDGFQHWLLRRDWDIVCIDTTNPWGGGALLPKGRLREKITSLRRANVVVLTRCELSSADNVKELISKIQGVNPKALILRTQFVSYLINSKDHKLMPENFLHGKKVVVLSSVGNPSSFELAVMKMGGSLFSIRFPDHHPYQDSDGDRVRSIVEKEKAIVVTTEKDWMKLKRGRWMETNPQMAFYILKINIKFMESDENLWIRSLQPFLRR